MKSNRFFVFASVVAALFVLEMGCRNPNDISKDLQSSVTKEGTAYEKMKSAQTEAGDIVADSYHSWVDSLVSLSNYSSELAEVYSKASSDKKKEYESSVNALAPSLDVVLGRNDSLK